MRPQFDHIAGAINWKPFTSADLPPGLTHDLDGILGPLYVATLELHRTVYRYELLAALGRNWDFVRKIDGTTTALGLNTVKGCVFTTLVISLCAYFDEGLKAVNLRAILNRVLRPEYLDRFKDFHQHTNPAFDTEVQYDRLKRLQRRLNRGETGKALIRLTDLRNQVVAHLDTEPEFDSGWPINADIAIVLAAVANIVISLVRFTISGRRIIPLLGRQDAQFQARTLRQSIRPSVIGRRGSVQLV